MRYHFEEMIDSNALKKYHDKISTTTQPKESKNYSGEKSRDNDLERTYDVMIQKDSSFLSPNKKTHFPCRMALGIKWTSSGDN